LLNGFGCSATSAGRPTAKAMPVGFGLRRSHFPAAFVPAARGDHVLSRLVTPKPRDKTRRARAGPAIRLRATDPAVTLGSRSDTTYTYRITLYPIYYHIFLIGMRRAISLGDIPDLNLSNRSSRCTPCIWSWWCGRRSPWWLASSSRRFRESVASSRRCVGP